LIALQKGPEFDAANHQLVLRVLQSANASMTAYEILHALRRNGFHSPPTVYRALKRLMDSGDVHRLESINAYLSYSNQKHHHGPVVFAICRECGHVDEMVGGTLTQNLKANAKQCGFRVEAAIIACKSGLKAATGDRRNFAHPADTLLYHMLLVTMPYPIVTANPAPTFVDL
jgi:Fur family zinc uptake transcriptional regulator